ncbi:uncharacterized protein LOC125785828 [Astyanax mexicanus]|uniref:uncharacterized protein LOC125785828 n=1 Tax=Astyanax mexicanus TaxID=7994 RepID=UPI0020CAA671|nr:uncharacterized protein LOC125785828 [Astyanax mexicanus]
MAAMVGTLTRFDNGNQSWEEYCEVLSHFFEANEITDAAKKRAILLSSVGSQAYGLMRNLLSPTKPGEKTYDELVELLKEHYNPKPSEIVQRFKFNSRNRKPKESVSEYVAVLRELAQHCNYGDKLTEMLRDRLVCGIEDDRMQRRLLAEAELTYDKALKLAQAIETASKGQSKSHSVVADKREMVCKFFAGEMEKREMEIAHVLFATDVEVNTWRQSAGLQRKNATNVKKWDT